MATSTITGNLTVKDANSNSIFYVDNNNQRVGINTTTPSTKLTITSSGTTGNFNLANSGILITNSDGDEILRVFASDTTVSNYNSLNLYIGWYAGESNPSDNVSAGYWNTGIGAVALASNTTGYQNTALGMYSLYNNETGFSNTAIGYMSIYENIYGSYNVGVGDGALESMEGSWNVAVGYETVNYNSRSFANTALGYRAGKGGTGASNASSTWVGYQAGVAIKTGSKNMALGYKAGDALTTGSGNIIIGYDIDLPAVTSDNTLNIANLLYGSGLGNTGTTMATGSIGIATTTPGGWYGEKFTVVGNTYTRGTATTTGNMIVGDGNSTATSTLEIGDIDTAGCIKGRDADADGWTYCYFENGTFNCSTTNVCDK